MTIGIDISQLAFENTGVANYLKNFVEALLLEDKKNNYVLFFSSLRGNLKNLKVNERTTIKKFPIPLSMLEVLWNKLHILPIESLLGGLDLFITSDWVEPPTKGAKKATIIYDLIVYKYPNETDSKIVDTQKRKLSWVKKESDKVFCISNSTAKDVFELLGIEKNKISVIYPGI